jgi:DNA polymerase III subunit delta
MGSMKLSSRDAAAWLARPDPDGSGALLYGADAMRVALRRQALVEAMVGPNGAAEMRLTRMAGSDLRRDPAALNDALRATGFFPGPRVVLVEDAADAQAGAIAAAFADWRPGDARMVVTAGALASRSALRKTFEAARHAVAIGIYADPPGRAEIEASLSAAGLADVPAAAMADLEALGRALDPGEFSQFIEKLALYKRGDPAPLGSEDIAACMTAGQPTEVDALVDLAAEGRASELAAGFAGFGARSSAATALTIAASRHYRALHAAAVDAAGPDAALSRARPPVFGPRRTRMAAQARALGPDRLEQALLQIVETELRLRSGRPTPALALVERLFVRLAHLRQGRR